MAKIKCKVCPNVFEKTKPLQMVCSFDCAIEYSRQLNDKKASKQRKKQAKEELMKVSDYKKILQALVNKAVRIIDQNYPCISCQKESNRYDAGHFHSTVAQQSLRFNFLNIWKQCSFNCNKSLSGNILNYQNEIERIYGKEFLAFLRLEMVRDYTKLQIDKEKTLEAIQIMRNELKTIKPAVTNEERMKKRIELNEKLRIYGRSNI